MTQPLHFPGCHPQSGAYHQQFLRHTAPGQVPRLLPTAEFASRSVAACTTCTPGWRASEQPTKYADQRGARRDLADRPGEERVMTPAACCSVTATPGSDPYKAQTVCDVHAAEGWQTVLGQIDHVKTLPCGCQLANLRSFYVSRCARHSISEYACCDQAKRLNCVCYSAFTCPEHGTRHVGSHD